MKPARGSQRPPSQAPNSKSKEPAEKRRHQKDPLRPGTSNQVKHTKPQKRKVSASKKVKGQENWKPMSVSSITALENMLDLSILSVIDRIRTEKEEVQKHLNTLKKRFLASCVELPVPVQKRGEIVHASRQHQEESKKSTQGKQTLATLEENLRAVVNTLEQMEEQTASLDHECSKLRQQLEENEAAQEVLLSQREALNLPPLPPRKDSQPTLQEKLLDLIPKADRGATALRLGTALQNGPIQNTMTLMKHVHRHTDHLLPPPAHLTNSNG
ncbi:centromere protein Q [Hypomesus transpacificus]|uniref:centromere protein Q n=1 Tax=Hypomesus transpacificus TaxID=137520 RepID=UPI001F082DC0|nr:centromere protein Q [Hypomesus transpacificus]